MTVSNTGIARKDYTGDGSVTVFAYDFRVLDKAHLEVQVGGVVQTITTDYTVSGVDASTGGNVTFTTAPATGKAVSIIRKVPTTQLTDYVENEDFTAATHETALDKIVMWSQQADESLGRALKFAKSSTKKDIDVPDPAASKFLRWDSTAAKLENAIGVLTTQTVSVSTGDKRKPLTTKDGTNLVFGDDLVLAPAEQTGADAFQVVEADLTLGAAFGSSTATAPVYGAAVMGNLKGTAGNTATSNILAGLIGKIDLTGTISSTYPVAAVIGEIGDGVLAANVDAAFMAVLGGDAAVKTTAGAAFGVDYLSSGPDSKFDYGLDLWRAAHNSYQKVSFAQAAIRIPSNEWIKSRNNADSADLSLARFDTSDRLRFGSAIYPSADATDDLGSSSIQWRVGYFSTGIATAGQAALKVSPFGTAAGNTGELRFLELAANGTNYVGFKAPDTLAANVIWTLPTADGTANQVLQTNGSAVLSWGAGVSAATQAEMEAASSTTVYASPGRTQYHPGVAKVWGLWNNAATIAASLNLTSITDTGAGEHVANFTTAFSSANWAAAFCAQLDQDQISLAGTKAAGTQTLHVRTATTAFGLVDPIGGWQLVGFGDQ